MEFDVVRGNGIDHVASPREGVHWQNIFQVACTNQH
jgi:hypothetical protein